MKHRNHEAFTLIELLVVISIVALLSSVVLASLNSARENARIAAARQFAANAYHAVGDQTAANFTFSEGSGNKTTDLSGTNVMSISSTNLWNPSDLPGESYVLTFNGSTDWAATQNVTMNGLNETMGIWVKTNAAPTTMIVGQNYSRRIYANQLVFIDGGGSYTYFFFSTPINDGKWHYVAYSISGTAVRIYLDGKHIGSATLAVPMNPSTAPWQIGGLLCSNTCTNYIAASYAGLHMFNGSIF